MTSSQKRVWLLPSLLVALEIRRLPRAKADLIEIWRYIARDNEGAADRLLDRVQSALLMLSNQPVAGRARPELHDDLRSFAVGNYIIFYTFGETTLTVVRVLSGFRDISEDMMR